MRKAMPCRRKGRRRRRIAVLVALPVVVLFGWGFSLNVAPRVLAQEDAVVTGQQRRILAWITRIETALQRLRSKASDPAGPEAMPSGKSGTVWDFRIEAQPGPVNAQLTPAYRAYLDASESLARDDLASARQAFGALLDSLERFDVGMLDEASRGGWDSIAVAARAALDAKDRAGFRLHFQDVSGGMTALVERYGHALPTPLYKVFCPMAFDNQGAAWLQAGRTIANPYYGAEMLRCGSFARLDEDVKSRLAEDAARDALQPSDRREWAPSIAASGGTGRTGSPDLLQSHHHYSFGGGTPEPHMDHTPHHRGVLYMNGNLHFETVLEETGRVTVYFSDAYRRPLASSVVTDMEVTLHPDDPEPEVLEVRPDPSGAYWEAQGKPIDRAGATVLVAYTYQDDPFGMYVEVAHPLRAGAQQSEQRETASRRRAKGSQIPGAINLGLSGKKRPGSYAATYLEKEMGKALEQGTYRQSGLAHFGGEPHEDIPLMVAAAGETVTLGARAPNDAPVRTYNISAINVEITLNQYHDFFPGYMFVLTENVKKVREEEARNEDARFNEQDAHDPGAVTNGLSGDMIQPLAIRVNQGERLVINLKNELEDEDEKVSFHVHGSSLVIQATGEPATATNADSYIEPGKMQTFEWYVPPDGQEGVRHFHSHIRDQASTGLFGSLSVEPRGSRFLDPYTGKELKSGWSAMIEDPNGPDFREFVVVYHEVGDEEFRPLDKAEEMILLRDAAADGYRPSTRAINYRSESFANNLLLQHKLFGVMDESLAYSAYTFGDPTTPIPRSYLGDPAKWRLVHGGSEVFHSHHLHGGAIRWRRQAKLTQDLNLFGTNNFALASNGPVKFPPVRTTSDRVDVQTIGPSETHDLTIECGSGGCQYTAGDFLYHCHIPHHYVAGMWAFWRTYNTLQIGEVRTDTMPGLAELPDRKGIMKPAVDSTALVGRTMKWFGKEFRITAEGGGSTATSQRELTRAASKAKVTQKAVEEAAETQRKARAASAFINKVTADADDEAATEAKMGAAKTLAVAEARKKVADAAAAKAKQELAAAQKIVDGAGADDKKRVPGVYSIEDWVETQLPPQGKPGKKDAEIEQIAAYDASVWDWAKEKTPDGKVLYLGEPETSVQWPKYKSKTPGARPKLLFDQDTGKLAWPHMRPHFGKRPPFSPDHNPAPFLEPFHENPDGSRSTRVARPGENGPWSLSPVETGPSQMKQYNVHAITLPITLSKAEGDLPPIVDQNGQIYVLHEEEERIRANDDLKIPLVLRANVGDTVDVMLTSELPDNDENLSSSKVNMHIHFVQFDTQASDGVITGMSYEQSVRPFTMLEDDDEGFGKPQNEPLTRAVDAGAARIRVRSVDPFQVGILLGIGMDQVGKTEIRRITAIEGDDLVLDEPLAYAHGAGEIVSTEFVRYRWYADVDFGITYWHDHAFGLTSWGHGLFGATVIEPKGSTYHDPVTGEPVRSGNVVDIHTNEPVSAQVRGSFREFVLQIQDSNPRTENRIVAGTVLEKQPEGQDKPSKISKLGSMDSWSLMDTAFRYLNGGERTSGSSFGLRVEPLNRRLAVNPDPSVLFSSGVHGDPDTPLLRAYLGDPIVLRALDHAGNEMHTIHVNGHYFPLERYAANARPKSTVHLGIAERYDLVIPAAGGPQQMAGDYLYHSGRLSHFGEGMWGIMRVMDEPVADLKPLPGREEIPKSAEKLYPDGAPVKTFNVSAIDFAMDLNPLAPGLIKLTSGTNRNIIAENANGKCFVLDAELPAVRAGTKAPHPLVLRANIGDVIKIHLTNRLEKGRVSFHADMLAYDPKDSLGINVGLNQGDQTIAPGESRTYTFYAHPEYGEAGALVTDWGDVTTHPRDGLYGAIVIGPRGSKYHDPATGRDISLENSWRADVVVDTSIPENRGRRNYRDVALFFQDEDNLIGTAFMTYAKQSAGLAAVNYRIEPLEWRSEHYGVELSDAYLTDGTNDPATPIIEAHAGDSMRIHVFGAHSEQNTIFSIEGHQWALEPDMDGSEMLESEQLGATDALEVNIVAGGPRAMPADYVWMNHRLAYAEAGQWGILRVLPSGNQQIAALGSPESPPTEPRAAGSRTTQLAAAGATPPRKRGIVTLDSYSPQAPAAPRAAPAVRAPQIKPLGSRAGQTAPTPPAPATPPAPPRRPIRSVMTVAPPAPPPAHWTPRQVPGLAPLPRLEPPDPYAVELGRMLFFDNRISGNADISCSTCHISTKGWTDGEALSTGYPGTRYFRNTPTILNVAYSDYLYWDGRLGGDDLATQARDSINDSHFLSSDGRIMLERMKQIPPYVELFEKASLGEPGLTGITKALAAFEQTLVSRNVPFDRYLQGGPNALSAAAEQGLALFTGKAGCIRCHKGPYLSDQKPHNLGVPENPEVFSDPFRIITFRSMLKFLGTPNYMRLRNDPGHFVVTKNYKDFGTFITPTLREVSRTAPYMHNGMLPTLAAVVDFYDRGGGSNGSNKSPLLEPLSLTGEEKAALVAFLESLSGDEIVMQVTQADLPAYELIADWYAKKN